MSKCTVFVDYTANNRKQVAAELREIADYIEGGIAFNGDHWELHEGE